MKERERERNKLKSRSLIPPNAGWFIKGRVSLPYSEWPSFGRTWDMSDYGRMFHKSNIRRITLRGECLLGSARRDINGCVCFAPSLWSWSYVNGSGITGGRDDVLLSRSVRGIYQILMKMCDLTFHELCSVRNNTSGSFLLRNLSIYFISFSSFFVTTHICLSIDKSSVAMLPHWSMDIIAI